MIRSKNSLLDVERPLQFRDGFLINTDRFIGFPQRVPDGCLDLLLVLKTPADFFPGLVHDIDDLDITPILAGIRGRQHGVQEIVDGFDLRRLPQGFIFRLDGLVETDRQPATPTIKANETRTAAATPILCLRKTFSNDIPCWEGAPVRLIVQIASDIHRQTIGRFVAARPSPCPSP